MPIWRSLYLSLSLLCLCVVCLDLMPWWYIEVRCPPYAHIWRSLYLSVLRLREHTFLVSPCSFYAHIWAYSFCEHMELNYLLAPVAMTTYWGDSTLIWSWLICLHLMPWQHIELMTSLSWPWKWSSIWKKFCTWSCRMSNCSSWKALQHGRLKRFPDWAIALGSQKVDFVV